MSVIPGTVPVAGKFAPTDSTDTYGLFDDEYFIGSHRGVPTLSDRNAIPVGRRKWTMLVSVGIVGAYATYQLTEGYVNTDISDNSNWVAFGGSGSLSIQEIIISAAGTAITPPSLGNIRLVELNVAADTQYTGLPAPSGSGLIYSLKLLQPFGAWFNRAIDGIGPGTAGDTETMILSGANSRILIVDSVVSGTYKSI